MDWLYGLLENRVLFATAIAWFIAQFSKIIYRNIRYGFAWGRIAESGGMPSTHSTIVCALATSVGLVDGSRSSSFIIAVFLAFIVMYDACGVRYYCGLDGKAINRLSEERKAQGLSALSDRPLPEKMGHTLPEIIAGAALGITTALIYCLVIMPL